MKYNCPFKLYDIIIYVDNPKESTEKKEKKPPGTNK